MKKLFYSLLLLFLIPHAVNAAGEPNVATLDAVAEDNGSIILYSGTTVNSAHAVMCKLLDGDDEIDMLSVEVENEGTNGTFAGSFIAPETGDYTVSCANYEGGTIVTADVTVESLTKVTVTFDTGDNENNLQVQVNLGEVVARPNPDPTKEGKEFAGWYEDSTYTRQFDFSTRITANATIYAKWDDAEEPVATSQVQVIFFGEGGTYQVDFAANDDINTEPLGEPVNSSHRYFVNEGDEVTLTAIPTNGYHLKGWYNTHETNGNEWVIDELLSSEPTYQFTPVDYANIQLVFEEDVEEPSEYTVTFNTLGGTEISPVNVEAGQKVSRPTPDPTKGNEIFGGWYEDETCTKEFDFNTPITANTTLYAKWTKEIFIVTFNTNGGNNIAAVEVEDGEKVIEPKEPTKDNYVFAGWYEDEELEHEYDFNNPITTNTTIYAKWNKEYNLEDDNNNEISFIDEPNQTLRLEITDFLELSDEELEEVQLNREAIEALMEVLTEASKKFGKLITVLDISVLDNNDEPIEVGKANIKLALTDKMNGYKSYKLVYIDTDDDDNFILNDAYPLKLQGEQLTGKLDHLSAYVLVGSNEEETTTNNTNNSTTSPKTFDNIMTWFIVLIISMIGLVLGTIKTKKIKK